MRIALPYLETFVIFMEEGHPVIDCPSNMKIPLLSRAFDVLFKLLFCFVLAQSMLSHLGLSFLNSVPLQKAD